jgi:hypothetical protein
MSLLQYAKDELDRIGMTADGDEYNAMMREHILHMVEEFSKEGHSGLSADYAINCLQKLLRFEPLSPLTGKDNEWESVRHLGDDPHYQNKRCSRVFKDKDGNCYDVDGYVFHNKTFIGYKIGVRTMRECITARNRGKIKPQYHNPHTKRLK